MSKTDSLSLFIFRRDLRLEDNTALLKALANSQAVIPCFIFDPRQCEPHPYRSEFGLLFLLSSLKNLQDDLKAVGGQLNILYGKSEEVIAQLCRTYPIKSIWVNQDYTPFSVTRDLAIERMAQAQGITFHSCEDLLLFSPKEVLKPQGQGPYTVFTPFYNRAKLLKVRSPEVFKGRPSYAPILKEHQPHLLDKLGLAKAEQAVYQGGRKPAMAILKRILEFKDYDSRRDQPFLAGTTHLSPHLKFGTISPREVYVTVAKHLGQEHTLIRELFWRDFFTHIAHHFPYVFNGAFYKAYDRLEWENNPEHFKAWCEGRTGFPLVDAGMRQLNQTGFMHNRVRMVVGSFLVKDLHCDWRWGERYFAQKLVDYDPCVNNGNWQWVASTGCDKQPYFRIFNPWLQQKKFDPLAQYIKQWVVELRSVPVGAIHEWYKVTKPKIDVDYPVARVIHEEQKAKILLKYKKI